MNLDHVIDDWNTDPRRWLKGVSSLEGTTLSAVATNDNMTCIQMKPDFVYLILGLWLYFFGEYVRAEVLEFIESTKITKGIWRDWNLEKRGG